jgi:hypothetical protein
VALAPGVTPAGPVFTTATSAAVVTVAVVVDVLFALLGSVVVVVTLATFETLLPLAADDARCITNEKVAETFDESDAIVHVIVPVPPTGGVAHAKAGPSVWDAETNVIPAGTASVSETVVAFDGPLFVTVTV